jgi:GNAT superfamily N-acetyltransferase
MFTIRVATMADVPSIHQCWLDTDFTPEEQIPVKPLGVAPWFPNLVEHGRMLVAESGDEIIGFAATVTRGRMQYLSECFVRPDWQSKGVTKQLLDALYEDPTLIRCTLASSDRRAVSRYMRAGMTPRWPMYILDLVDVTKVGTPRYRAEVCTDVAEWLHYDYRLVGHDRSVDIVHYFVERCDAALLQIKDGARLVGQALVQRRHYDPGVVGARNVGPVGVFDRVDAAHAVHAAVAWVVADGVTKVHMRIPAEHAGLPWMIEHGMHIDGAETYCASQEWFDPTCYAPSGLM